MDDINVDHNKDMELKRVVITTIDIQMTGIFDVKNKLIDLYEFLEVNVRSEYNTLIEMGEHAISKNLKNVKCKKCMISKEVYYIFTFISKNSSDKSFILSESFIIYKSNNFPKITNISISFVSESAYPLDELNNKKIN